MPGIPQVRKGGPATYVPASGVTVLGGQVVEARSGGRIGPAAAGSVVAVGVALQDAIAPEDLVTTATTVNQRSVLNTAVLPQNVAVVTDPGTEVPVVYAAAATFGQALICAANGQVTPAGATPDARTLIGTCAAPGGVGVGATGLMRWRG
jgi:hypothetical protein